jgi:CubicO group peptidase (beta-lactamase class C family)
MRKLPLSLLLLAALTEFCFAQAPPLQGIDSLVENVRKAFAVPGISVAVVKDGQVLLARGYGIKRMGKSDPVDSKTRFGIASNTKAFTATALGMLVEEGKLSWDGKVIDYFPSFQLSDPYVTREMTIRDLLVHRSGLGLGAGDLLWWPASTYDRKEIVRRLRHIPLATSFRSAYAYDNVLYLVAGEVLATASGTSWENFIQTRLLDPLGMTGSTTRHSDAGRGGNVAVPHAEVDGKVRPIAAFDSDNTNPAGGINSCADDMAKWMICQLDSGRLVNGKRLFSQGTTRNLWSIVTPRSVGGVPPQLASMKAAFLGYGLGFDIRDYRGTKLVTHTGGLPGYVSRVAMIPELKVGVAVLTNQESGEAFNTVAFSILDRFIGGEFDLLSGYRWLKARNDSLNQLAEVARLQRDEHSHPSLPDSAYIGRYADIWYGDMQIEKRGDKLRIQMIPTPSLRGDLVHFQYDTFIARWDDPEIRADAFVTFWLNPDGSIQEVRMRAVSPETDFSFDYQDLAFQPAKR